LSSLGFWGPTQIRGRGWEEPYPHWGHCGSPSLEKMKRDDPAPVASVDPARGHGPGPLSISSENAGRADGDDARREDGDAQPRRTKLGCGESMVVEARFGGGGGGAENSWLGSIQRQPAHGRFPARDSAGCGPSFQRGSLPLARCNSTLTPFARNQPQAATTQPQRLHQEIRKRPGVSSRAEPSVSLSVRLDGPILRRQRPCAAPSRAPEDGSRFSQKPADPDFLSLPSLHQPSSSQRQHPPPRTPSQSSHACGPHHEDDGRICCINYLCAHHVARSAAPDLPPQPATRALESSEKPAISLALMVSSVPPLC
jgi:hypothetical protein